LRSWFAVALSVALLISSPAQAIPCWIVKATYAPFAKHGIHAAEKWAREHGYSEETIREARKCLIKLLHSASAHDASFMPGSMT